MAPSASNVIPLPGISVPSTRPTLPPPESGDALAIPQLDTWGKVAFSVTQGIAAAASGGGPKGTSWLAGVIVAIGLAMVAGLSILGYQVNGLSEDIGSMKAGLQDYGDRIDVIEQRLDATQDAVVMSRDADRSEKRWANHLLLDMYRAQFPGRDPNPAPDNDARDRAISGLR